MPPPTTAAEMKDLAADFVRWYERSDPDDMDFGRDLQTSGFVERFRDAADAAAAPLDPLAATVRRERRLDVAVALLAGSPDQYLAAVERAGAVTVGVANRVQAAFALADYVLAFHDDDATRPPPVPAAGWPRVARVAPPPAEPQVDAATG